MAQHYSRRPAIERVDERCSYQDRGYVTPCRVIGGYLNKGYGMVGVGSETDGTKRKIPAHRVVWEHRHGPIPEGMHLDHLCRVPACCEVDHLEIVTPRENTLRGLRGRLVTHCPQGHEYTPQNTASHHGRRECRRCHALRSRRNRMEKRLSRITCEARFHDDGTPCPHAAIHTHRTQQGDLLRLCGIHLRTILRRERLGSDDELARRWREG